MIRNILNVGRVSILIFITLIGCQLEDEGKPPIVLQFHVTDIKNTTVTFSGGVSPNGSKTFVSFEYGTTSDYGNSVRADERIINGSVEENVSATLVDLSPGSVYYSRIRAENIFGVTFGDQIIFTTKNLPALSTLAIIKDPSSSYHVFTGGNILYSGGDIIARGVCWGTNHNPTKENNYTIEDAGAAIFNSEIIGLDANHNTYYARAYATNSQGTSYGNELSFETDGVFFTPGNGVTDIDGNTYSSVLLAKQEWMSENLKVSKYQNGDPIPNFPADGDHTLHETLYGAFAYYDDEPSYNNIYGKLYNWFAVTDPRGLCPSGWHVPSNDEFVQLINFIGGPEIAGKKMKSTGNNHWNSPNTATNECGFTALPGGLSYDGILFTNLREASFFYTSSTEGSLGVGKVVRLENSEVYNSWEAKSLAYSVRCIKNQ